MNGKLPAFDRQFCILLALVLGLPAVTVFPSLLGVLQRGAYFSGCLENIHDQNIYFSFISQAREGFLFFINAPCSIPHSREYLNLTFLAVGWLSGASGLSMELSYVISSYLFGVAACACLACLFHGTAKGYAAAAGLCIAWAGAGFGVFWKAAYMIRGISIDKANMAATSGDLWMAEMSIWHSAAYSPLFISSYLMLLLAYGGIWLAERREKMLPLVVAAGAAFYLALSHSYDIIPLAVVSSAMMILFRLEKKSFFSPQVFAGYALFAAGIIAGTAYQYYVLKYNPGFSIWANQNVNRPPPLHSIFSGYGVLSLGIVELALLLAFERGRMNIGYKFMASWLVLQALLLYSPFPFSRRFILGLIIPLSFFFLLFLLRLWKKGTLAKLAAAALFIGAFPTFIYQEAANAGKVFSLDQRYFFSGERIQAYSAMSALGHSDVIMGSLEESNCLLRFTRAQMACASQQQSSPGAKEALEKILSGDSSGLDKFLEEHRVTYIFLDRKAQASFISANRSFLDSQEIFFENLGYAAYKVAMHGD